MKKIRKTINILHISWATPCNEKESNIIKLSELKFYLNEPIFEDWTYKDIQNSLDLKYSLLLFGLKHKKPVDENLFYEIYNNALKILEKYIDSPKEEYCIYNYIISPQHIPTLVGRCLSALSSTDIEKDDCVSILNDIVEKNIELVIDELLSKINIRPKSIEDIDPKIIFGIMTSKDKSEDGIIEAIHKITGWSEKRCKNFFIQLLKEGRLVKKDGKYVFPDYYNYNLK